MIGNDGDAILNAPDREDTFAARDDALLIVALCAQWCGTCREFRPLLERHVAGRNDCAVRWCDIEDEAELLGDVDVEDFPTLLIIRGEQVCYFGTSLPLEPVVAQLLRAVRASSAPIATIPAAVQQFSARLLERHAGS